MRPKFLEFRTDEIEFLGAVKKLQEVVDGEGGVSYRWMLEEVTKLSEEMVCLFFRTQFLFPSS